MSDCTYIYYLIIMNLSTYSIRSRSKRTWSNSRYIDNHYDSKLHSTPFLPCGLKYEISTN